MPARNLTNENTPDPNLEWAAYVVGRHPQAIRAWQTIVWRIAVADAPWHPLTSPIKVFCQSCRQLPFQLFGELDSALVDLAIAKLVDAGLLVELHRQLDRSRESCERFAEMVADDDREGIDEEYAWQDDCWTTVGKLASSLLEKVGDYPQWTELGIVVGEWLVALLYYDCRPPLRAVESLKLPGDRQAMDALIGPVLTLAREQWDAQEADYRGDDTIKAMGWVDRLAEFDQGILRLLLDKLTPRPLVLIDEPRRELEFLGVRFPFDEFRGRASGGLRCFRVLAENAIRPVTCADIIRLADVTIDEHRLHEYFSGFRGVVKRATSAYLDNSPPQKRELAKKAYIVAKARKQKHNTPGTYQLQLSPSRVRVIRAVEGGEYQHEQDCPPSDTGDLV